MSSSPPPFQGPVSTRTRTTAAASSRSLSAASTGSRSQSHNTLNFFRNIIGQRNNDYVSDAPPPMETQSPMNVNVRGPSTRSMASRMTSAHTLNDGEGRAWCGSAEARREFCARILDSLAWRALLILLTLILLFGAQIRNMFIPASADAAADAVFLATFFIFWIDIGMRVIVEPNYFAFNLCGLGRKIDTERPMAEQETCCNVQLGSFLFWCDVISTLTLLHEISFIDKANFSEIPILVTLDPFGVPNGGLESINAPSPVELDIDLYVTIGKTTRVARFIRSSTAVKISSRVNWYLFLNIVNPYWWWQKLSNSMHNREPNQTPSELEFVRSSSLGGGATGEGGHRATMSRRASWSGLGLHALATVRAHRASTGENQQPRPSILSMPLRALRSIGLLPVDHDEICRQIAATKIQRAWRNYHYRNGNQGYGDLSEEMTREDVAWKRTSRAENPVEVALQKRSWLHRYSRMNKNQLRSSGKPSAMRLSRIPLRSSRMAKKRNESQVGTAMREITGQRVAIGIIVALVLTALFTYKEQDSTRPSTMIVLHTQTAIPDFASKSLNAARNSSIPDLFSYQMANGTDLNFSVAEVANPQGLRPREVIRVTVQGADGNSTVGLFAFKNERRQEALVSILSTFFILLVWFFGVTAFAGPVMVLVVIPIERMVRLLGMLMVDPLGYENSPRYKRFMEEEDAITRNTRWTKEILKGMETSFLMSTILRIGSLMKVGFGSAGVEIIRNNLQKGQNKNMLMLSSEGSSVSCIFLFCDIRQFTDATECLQEEVFVFTNKIAAVVHSICHAYGGSANKNIGDAFLLSWLLDEEKRSGGSSIPGASGDEDFTAKHNQADKALLSVVKICMALHYDEYYINTMSPHAREALMAKLSKRKGPIVQMGCGLHAGKAVQGAIGSQRKIDATYVSEHVERAEFLESATKQYGVKMLMSDSFHRLLHPSNRRRCRKIDQILIQDDDDAEDDYLDGDGKIIELLTFDMDIDALWRGKNKKGSRSDTGHESDSEIGSERGTAPKREGGRLSGGMLKAARRRSVRITGKEGGSDELSEGFSPTPANSQMDFIKEDSTPPELVLPTGPALYNANVWISEDIRRIRQLYVDGLFFQKFNSGLQSFYARDWEHAKQCFTTILDRFEDGPSRYFLNQIEKNDGIPPRDFKGYGVA